MSTLTLLLWYIVDGAQLLGSFQASVGPVFNVFYHPLVKGQWAAYGRWGTIVLRDEAGVVVKNISTGMMTAGGSMHFSPTRADEMFTSPALRGVRRWDLSTGQGTEYIAGSSIGFHGVHPNGDELVGCGEKDCTVWDRSTPATPKSTFAQQDARKVVYNPLNPDQVLIGDKTGVAVLWDIAQAVPKNLRQFVMTPGEGVGAILFLPGTKEVILGDYKGLVKIWNWETGVGGRTVTPARTDSVVSLNLNPVDTTELVISYATLSTVQLIWWNWTSGLTNDPNIPPDTTQYLYASDVDPFSGNAIVAAYYPPQGGACNLKVWCGGHMPEVRRVSGCDDIGDNTANCPVDGTTLLTIYGRYLETVKIPLPCDVINLQQKGQELICRPPVSVTGQFPVVATNCAGELTTSVTVTYGRSCVGPLPDIPFGKILPPCGLPVADSSNCTVECDAGFWKTGDLICNFGNFLTVTCGSSAPCVNLPVAPTKARTPSCPLPVPDAAHCSLDCEIGYLPTGDFICSKSKWNTPECRRTELTAIPGGGLKLVTEARFLILTIEVDDPAAAVVLSPDSTGLTVGGEHPLTGWGIEKGVTAWLAHMRYAQLEGKKGGGVGGVKVTIDDGSGAPVVGRWPLPEAAFLNRPVKLLNEFPEKTIEVGRTTRVRVPPKTFEDTDTPPDGIYFSAHLDGFVTLPPWIAFQDGWFDLLPERDQIGEWVIKVRATDVPGTVQAEINFKVIVVAPLWQVLLKWFLIALSLVSGLGVMVKGYRRRSIFLNPLHSNRRTGEVLQASSLPASLVVPVDANMSHLVSVRTTGPPTGFLSRFHYFRHPPCPCPDIYWDPLVQRLVVKDLILGTPGTFWCLLTDSSGVLVYQCEVSTTLVDGTASPVPRASDVESRASDMLIEVDSEVPPSGSEVDESRTRTG